MPRKSHGTHRDRNHHHPRPHALYDVEALTLSEIATVLDLPEERVWQLYTGARNYLRTQLAA